MTAANPFGHPRWGLQFHWWAVDPAGRVGLFYSAFGPVPTAARRHAPALDRATAAARARHPEWFDTVCHADFEDCPVTHCVVRLGHAPYLFTWDEEFDDRYTRFGVPSRPVHLAELPEELARAALLVPVGFPLSDAVRVDLAYPDGRERLSATASDGGPR
ncbi:hypothetical protein [Kitasatospora sp. NPDC001175]|uniref:hypothetical protein n=1 Tax=Kitasatospora sp. NPDC001175 TaxID=3157103 RepID=UPI003D069119